MPSFPFLTPATRKHVLCQKPACCFPSLQIVIKKERESSGSVLVGKELCPRCRARAGMWSSTEEWVRTARETADWALCGLPRVAETRGGKAGMSESPTRAEHLPCPVQAAGLSTRHHPCAERWPRLLCSLWCPTPGTSRSSLLGRKLPMGLCVCDVFHLLCFLVGCKTWSQKMMEMPLPGWGEPSTAHPI